MSGHTTTSTPKSKGKFGGAIMLVLAVAFFFVIKGMFFSSSSSKSKEGDRNTPTPTAGSPVHYTKTRVVKYNGKYGESIQLTSGFYVNFLDASESYCAVNSAGKEFHGKKNQDIELGSSGSNTEIWLKSENGKEATVTIMETKMN